jgi:hypothetical protein
MMHVRASLPEERARNHSVVAKHKNRKNSHEAWKAAEITKRDQNHARAKRRRAGDEDVSSNEDRESSPSTSDEDDDDEDVVAAATPRAGR